MSQKATIVKTHHRLASRRGFTLIEMGVVTFLLALFAAMIVPAVAHWQAGEQYRSFPGRMLRFVAQVKQDAIDNKQARTLGYEATTGDFHEYWTDPQSQQQQEGSMLTIPPEMQLGRLVYLGNDSSVQDWQVTFYPDGTAEDAGCEVRDQDQYVTIQTTSLGQITESTDPLPEQSDIKWSAGNLEQRTQ